MGGLTVGLVVAVTALVTHAWQRVRQRQMAASLILEMLDRGMSADEMAQVLQAAGMDKDADQNPIIERLRARFAGRAE